MAMCLIILNFNLKMTLDPLKKNKMLTIFYRKRTSGWTLLTLFKKNYYPISPEKNRDDKQRANMSYRHIYTHTFGGSKKNTRETWGFCQHFPDYIWHRCRKTEPLPN